MRPVSRFDSLERTRLGVRWARSRAAAPTAQSLRECLPVLEAAAADLKQLTVPAATQDAPRGRGETLRQLRALKTELRNLSTLLQQAAGFYAGWMHLCDPQDDGYDAHGAPQSRSPAHSLSVEG